MATLFCLKNKKFIRGRGVLSLAAVLLAALVPLSAQAAPPSILVEPFSGISTPTGQWISGGGPSGSAAQGFACLTAATVTAPGSVPACTGGPTDAPGSGALRLTTNTNDQAGFAILDVPFSAGQGVQVEFDMFQYNSATLPLAADGIAFFLIDGAANPTVSGADGGSLGYSRGNFPGLVGGHIGVAFDYFGNFSSDNGLSTGGPGQAPNHIALRGAESTNYAFISNYNAATAGGSGGQLSVPTATTRAPALRHVTVNISKSNILNVFVDYGAGPVHQVVDVNLNALPGQPPVPATFKLGFAGGTGGANNIHEVQNFSVVALRPDLDITVSAPAGLAQGVSTVQLDVHNDPAAGSTYDTVMATATLPAGVTPTTASGDGWSCAVSGQTVTCTRPGTGADALASDAHYPLIQIGVAVSAPVASTLTITANVAVLDDTDLTNNDASADFIINPAPPVLASTGTNASGVTLAAFTIIATPIVYLLWQRARQV